MSTPNVSNTSIINSEIQEPNPVHQTIVPEEGNFTGSSIRSTTSSSAAAEMKEGALDQFMQILGNPLKTITSVPIEMKPLLPKRPLIQN